MKKVVTCDSQHTFCQVYIEDGLLNTAHALSIGILLNSFVLVSILNVSCCVLLAKEKIQ